MKTTVLRPNKPTYFLPGDEGISDELKNKFDPYKFSDPIDQWDFENEINSCQCYGCGPTDQPIDEDCYPYRNCISGKIIDRAVI